MSPPPASWIRKIDITANLEGVVEMSHPDYPSSDSLYPGIRAA
jgi:hypothetical protein